jgi:hypothetical protein
MDRAGAVSLQGDWSESLGTDWPLSPPRIGHLFAESCRRTRLFSEPGRTGRGILPCAPCN